MPAIFFLFLPFFKKIKLGTIELEREVEKAKKELSDFKGEMRNTISVLSTNVNTIGRMTNQVTVNLPSLAELQQARQNLAATIPPDAEGEVRQVEDNILRQSDDDRTMALARVRIDIEGAIRRLLAKDAGHTEGREKEIKYAGVHQLFQILLQRFYPDLKKLQQSFQYVTQICNAAIHAQPVSGGQAAAALSLGAEILTALILAEQGIILRKAAK